MELLFLVLFSLHILKTEAVGKSLPAFSNPLYQGYFYFCFASDYQYIQYRLSNTFIGQMENVLFISLPFIICGKIPSIDFSHE